MDLTSSPASDEATDDRPPAPPDRTTPAFVWTIGAIVVGSLAVAALVVLVAGALILRGVEPGELGGTDSPVLVGEPGPGGDAFAEARRCRATMPVTMHIAFDAPSPTAASAASVAKDQVGEEYAVTTWTLVEEEQDGTWWAGVAADGSLRAVFDIERAGSGWSIGDIRAC